MSNDNGNGNGNDEKEQVEPLVFEVADDGDVDTEFEIPLGDAPDVSDIIREAIEAQERARSARTRPAIECFREITTDESVAKALNGKALLGYAIILIDEDGQQTSAAFMPLGENEGKTACGLIAGLEVRKFAILHHGIGS